MIKRQYRIFVEINRATPVYFQNFMKARHSEDPATLLKQTIALHGWPCVEYLNQLLIPYEATLGKCKRYDCYNVKWRNKKKYMMFVLRWS